MFIIPREDWSANLEEVDMTLLLTKESIQEVPSSLFLMNP